MKTKKVALVLFVSLGVVLAGCAKNGFESGEGEKIEQIVTSNQLSVEVTGVLTGVSEDGKKGNLRAEVKLKNPSEEDIALNKEAKKLIQVELKNENGKVVYSKMIEDDLVTLESNETLKWEIDTPLETEGTYTLTAELLVKDGDVNDRKKVVYDHDVDLKSIIKFEWYKDSVSFLPTEGTTYTYMSELQNQSTIVEEVLFKENNFVQTYESAIGTKVYYEDETGLYNVDVTGEEQTKENIIEKVAKNQKTKLLSYPLKANQAWEADGGKYKVVSVKEEVETSAGLYSDVAEVQVSFGGTAKYYYKENIGLIKAERMVEKEDGSSEWEILLNLQELR